MRHESEHLLPSATQLLPISQVKAFSLFTRNRWICEVHITVTSPRLDPGRILDTIPSSPSSFSLPSSHARLLPYLPLKEGLSVKSAAPPFQNQSAVPAWCSRSYLVKDLWRPLSVYMQMTLAHSGVKDCGRTEPEGETAHTHTHKHTREK